jgi:hypothetical protein
MSIKLRLRLITLLLCLSFVLLLSKPAEAQTGGIGPSKNQVIGIFVAVAAVGAAIGVGIYFAVRQSPSLKGCTASSPTGLTLLNENDQKLYTLIGDTSTIKSGDRFKVSGKKKKQQGLSAPHDFLVEKVSKDYGACKV